MYHRFFCLLLTIMGCMALAGAEEMQTMEVNLPKPFNQLTIPSSWKFYGKDENGLVWQHISNDEVTFSFSTGKTLSKSAKFDDLEKQMKRFAKGKAKSVPLVLQSLGLAKDYDMSAELQITSKDLSRVRFNKVKWMRLYDTSEEEMITVFKNGDQEVTETKRLKFVQ